VHDPLFAAKALNRTEFFRAGGALAGVVLENHLQELCKDQTPPIQPTGHGINKLNEALKNALVYDQTQFHRVQVMGDIRNRCDHSVSNPPSKEEVSELIEDVGKLLNAYPVRLRS